MNRKKFMRQLRRRLRSLPGQERGEALRYYEELFDEAGAGQEAELIARLGQPVHLAEQILEDARQKGTKVHSKTDLGKPILIFFAIMASPIVLTLGVAAGAAALALAAVGFALILSLAVGISALIIGFLAIVLGGVALAVVGCCVWYDWPSALFFLGMGLAAIGLGCLGSLGMLWVGRQYGLLLRRLLNGFRERRRARREKK